MIRGTAVLATLSISMLVSCDTRDRIERERIEIRDVEIVERNNIPILPIPDLVLKNIELVAEIVVDDWNIWIDVDVENTGHRATSYDIQGNVIIFYADTMAWERPSNFPVIDTFPVLNPNATAHYTLSVPIPVDSGRLSSGNADVRIEVWVDPPMPNAPGGKVWEFDETNNSMGLNQGVGPP